MSTTRIQPVRPDDLEYPEELVARINQALKERYQPWKGKVFFNWDMVIQEPYHPVFMDFIKSIYEPAGWIVTYFPPDKQPQLSELISFERK